MINLTDDSRLCLTCNARLTIPGLQRCCSCGTEYHLDANETNRVEQQTRLLQSWGVVIRDSDPHNQEAISGRSRRSEL